MKVQEKLVLLGAVTVAGVLGMDGELLPARTESPLLVSELSAWLELILTA